MVFGGSQVFAEDGGATPAEIEEIIVKASWRGTRLEKAMPAFLLLTGKRLQDNRSNILSN